MKTSSVTLVIVPRERFSLSVESLQDVLSKTPAEVAVVYVEGNPPNKIKSRLHAVGAGRVDFIGTPDYVAPNQARNIGFTHVDTKYVAFLDNDVWVEPNWLDLLVDCAEETGAEVVSPLYRQGRREDREVHMAGGLAHIVEKDGVRRVKSTHDYQGQPLDDVLPKVKRGETELAEFHGVLIKADVLRDIGGLDEGLLSTREHIDFCMTVRNRGGTVIFEPASQITYTRPPPFAWSDLGFFSLRWSEDWSRRTLEHFCEKWDVDRAQIPYLMIWTKKQRYRFLDPWYSHTTKWLARRFGKDRVIRVMNRTIYPIEGALNRLMLRMMRLKRG